MHATDEESNHQYHPATNLLNSTSFVPAIYTGAIVSQMFGSNQPRFYLISGPFHEMEPTTDPAGVAKNLRLGK